MVRPALSPLPPQLQAGVDVEPCWLATLDFHSVPGIAVCAAHPAVPWRVICTFLFN